MIITNLIDHGGDLESQFFDLLRDRNTDRLRMVSGYVGKEMVTQLRNEIRRRKNVAVDLVVGMAAKEGLAQATYESLIDLQAELRSRQHQKIERQGVFAFFSGPNGERSRGMHAKAYLFDSSDTSHLIVGSSNFSFSGLSGSGNVEMNLLETNPKVIAGFEDFFEGLHSQRLAVPIDQIQDFPIRGKAQRARSQGFPSLTRVRPPADFKTSAFVDLDLARNIEKQTRSNLNCCFGKGRWARNTGVVRPRDWYEVELIAPMEVTSSPNYPRGEFDALTSDGYSFRAVTNGDYFKNFRSFDDLKILGIWLKGLLEDSGALSDDPQEMVTRETFREYGNSILRIYRPAPRLAILHFPRNPKDL